eukprot:3746492-Rhodomonas_salina.3
MEQLAVKHGEGPAVSEESAAAVLAHPRQSRSDPRQHRLSVMMVVSSSFLSRRAEPVLQYQPSLSVMQTLEHQHPNWFCVRVVHSLSALVRIGFERTRVSG